MKNHPDKIIIVGAFHEIIELAEDNGIEIAGMIDNILTGSYRDYKILCNDKEAPNLNKTSKNIPVLITPDIPSIRKKLHIFYKESGFIFSLLISGNSSTYRIFFWNKILVIIIFRNYKHFIIFI